MKLDHFRLAIAVAHVTPGAELVLRCADGQRIVAAAAAGADIGLCQMRQVALVSAMDGQSNHVESLEGVEIGGSLLDLGGGVHFDRWSGRHVLASFLPPAEVVDAARRVVPEDVIYTIASDPELEVSVVRFAATDPSPDRPICQIARRTMAECWAGELDWSVRRAEATGVV